MGLHGYSLDLLNGLRKNGTRPGLHSSYQGLPRLNQAGCRQRLSTGLLGYKFETASILRLLGLGVDFPQ